MADLLGLMFIFASLFPMLPRQELPHSLVILDGYERIGRLHVEHTVHESLELVVFRDCGTVDGL